MARSPGSTSLTSRVTARLAITLTASVKADATKKRPGSEMRRTPLSAGKYASRAGRSSAQICRGETGEGVTAGVLISTRDGRGSHCGHRGRHCGRFNFEEMGEGVTTGISTTHVLRPSAVQ